MTVWNIRTVVKKVFTEWGDRTGHGIHSWRCEYPDQYGDCSCVDEFAADVEENSKGLYQHWQHDLFRTVHAFCDCVPELGPAHCHACSGSGNPVAWADCVKVREVTTVPPVPGRVSTSDVREVFPDDGPISKHDFDEWRETYRLKTAREVLEQASSDWTEWEVFIAGDGYRSIRRHGLTPTEWLHRHAHNISGGDS